MAKKTFNEKLNFKGDLPKVEKLTNPRLIERYKTTTLVIAAPLEYDGLMKKVPAGKLTTIDRMMAYMAKKHEAGCACPMTAGIFVNLSAHASEERAENKIPWWRTLKAKGELNEKYPGGIDAHKSMLETDGHTVIQKGKRYFVADYEDSLIDL
jgi:hypothetical protein